MPTPNAGVGTAITITRFDELKVGDRVPYYESAVYHSANQVTSQWPRLFLPFTAPGQLFP